jgi:hypothetical protein
MKNALRWLPRILSVAFIVFLSLFVFEVFTGHQGSAIFLNFFFALVPAGIALIATIIAWRWKLAGAISFFIIALAYVWMVGLGRDWSWYASIFGPATIIGILFLLDWRYDTMHK